MSSSGQKKKIGDSFTRIIHALDTLIVMESFYLEFVSW